jgi:hypothetical protein
MHPEMGVWITVEKKARASQQRRKVGAKSFDAGHAFPVSDDGHEGNAGTGNGPNRQKKKSK